MSLPELPRGAPVLNPSSQLDEVLSRLGFEGLASDVLELVDPARPLELYVSRATRPLLASAVEVEGSCRVEPRVEVLRGRAEPASNAVVEIPCGGGRKPALARVYSLLPSTALLYLERGWDSRLGYTYRAELYINP